MPGVRFSLEQRRRRCGEGGVRWGVEPICRLLTEHELAIAPATYYAAKTRPPSVRAVRDGELKPLIAEVHGASRGSSAGRSPATCAPNHRCLHGEISMTTPVEKETGSYRQTRPLDRADSQ